MSKSTDILILTASFGLGHNNVAKAIKDQIIMRDSSANVIVKDIFEIINPNTNHLMYQSYKYLITNHADVYNYFYYKKMKCPYTLPDKIVYKANLKKFDWYFFQVNPDAVVSTFPICSGMVSRFKHEYNNKVPLITCITDIVNSMEWVHDDTDLYFVPIYEVKEGLICRGVKEDAVRVTGIPVRKEFLTSCTEKASGFKKNFNVLIMGGGFGNFIIDSEFLKWIDKKENIKSEIITGVNRKLYNRLAGDGLKNVSVYGYLDNVEEHMDEADVLITKPGGITIFEALHKRVPMVVSSPDIGQEIENSKFITKSGIGINADGCSGIENFIEDVLHNSDKLSKMRHNMEEISEELEPDMIGKYIFDIL